MHLPDSMPMDTDIENMTPYDALLIGVWLLDHDMPVPLDVVVKAQSGGFYFAH